MGVALLAPALVPAMHLLPLLKPVLAPGLSFCHSMIQLGETGPSACQEQPDCTTLPHHSSVLPLRLTSDSPGTPLSSLLLTLSWLFYQQSHRVS